MQLIAIVLFSVFFLGAGDDAEARFNALGHNKLICVCGCNQLLLECNHVGCTYSDTMRKELLDIVYREKDDKTVLNAFVQKYGPTVLAAPTTSGFNLVAWITPFAVLLAGFACAGMIVMSWKNKPLLQPEAAEGSEPLDKFREQVRRETEI
jgi:cytochrome c-type biogenesis protein CcmH